MGLTASHRVEELRARQAVAEAVVESRRAADRPQIAVIGGYARTSHIEEFGLVGPAGDRRVIFPDIPDNYRSRLDLQWPLYTWGRTDAVVEGARAEAAAVSETSRPGSSIYGSR